MEEFFDPVFWKDFASNALATFIGAILGIPVGLWLGRRQQESSEKSMMEREAIESAEQEKRILQLLEIELNTNYNELATWGDDPERWHHAATLSALMKTELWNTFSDGGALGVIEDPYLLDGLSHAYFSVRSVRYLSDKYTSLYGMDPRAEPMIALTRSLTDMVESTRRVIRMAVDQINNALTPIPSDDPEETP